ncbi:FadR/GntR family transcriptional regulator [Georgenia muralis]|uniref:GntR family transcriptional regulator n=1 Tax=Georgenia muralis TaxID=154117 RepID=A0A3N4ZMN2_9MICO|nr:FCD domain-containing protein [Georgenia muralis]RPF27028.1 GntR family transcriptional regulator [Georgenia muralis]
MTESVRPATVLFDQVLDRLGQELVDGVRAPGSVLTLADLEEEFAVSRTVVREAVRVLESLCMVRSQRRVGLTVRPREDWSVLDPQVIGWRLGGVAREEALRDLTELRIAVEPVAARLAARRASAQARSRLTELAERLAALGSAGRGDSADYLEADIEFHTLLLHASGNELLAALTDVVVEVLTGRTRLGLSPAVPVPGATHNHEEVARAVADGDHDAAERFARAVVAEVWGFLESSGLGHPDPPVQADPSDGPVDAGPRST